MAGDSRGSYSQIDPEQLNSGQNRLLRIGSNGRNKGNDDGGDVDAAGRQLCLHSRWSAHRLAALATHEIWNCKNFLTLSLTHRPHMMARTILEKASSIRIMSEASLATSVPLTRCQLRTRIKKGKMTEESRREMSLLGLTQCPLQTQRWPTSKQARRSSRLQSHRRLLPST